VYCTDPPDIKHARHDGQSDQTIFPLNATLNYTCNDGFITGGFPAARCVLYNNTSKWFGPDITCEGEIDKRVP
jgi:hypothetical protein